MIFRRSLVRELTATTIGLFVVLLAILFTQSVIRILGRAAGGAIAVRRCFGVDRLQRDVLFEPPAVRRVVPDGIAHVVSLVPRQRNGGLVYVGTVPDGLPEANHAVFAAPFLVAIVLLSLFLSPWAEQRKLEFERQLEQRDEVGVLAPGLFKEFKRAGLVVYVESLQSRSMAESGMYSFIRSTTRRTPPP